MALGIAVMVVLALVVMIRSERRRRRAEGAEQVVAGQLRTITATMREGVIAYDMDLQLTFVNPAFERLTGYPAEDIQDQEFLQYVHPDDRPALLAEWERLAQGGSLRDQEYRVVTRSGQVRWYAEHLGAAPRRAGRQIGYLGTEFDITERKLAEAEMRLDTELFQAVIEVQQAVAGAGLDSRTVMHVIAERSQRLTGASGGGDRDHRGRRAGAPGPIGARGPPLAGDRKPVRRLRPHRRAAALRRHPRPIPASSTRLPRPGHPVAAGRAARGRAATSACSRWSRPSRARSAIATPRRSGSSAGSWARRWATPRRTRRGRAGWRSGPSALQESEQRFKQLVDVAQEGIWVADDRGVITYVNQRMAELLGYQNGAMLGRPVYDFIDATARAGAQRTLGASGRGRGEPGPPVPPPGRHRALGAGLRQLRSPAGTACAVGTVGMVTDITERKRAEERLRRSAERLGMLHDMDQAILAARSPAEIGRAALGRVRRMVPCQRCSDRRCSTFRAARRS